MRLTRFLEHFARVRPARLAETRVEFVAYVGEGRETEPLIVSTVIFSVAENLWTIRLQKPKDNVASLGGHHAKKRKPDT